MHMKIIINTFFLRPEFVNTTISDEIINLGVKMNAFFENRSYSPLVDTIYMRLYCYSDFYKPYKYPQYMENVRGKTPCHGVSWPIFHSLLVEILFDPIDRLLFAKGSEVLSVIGSEIITYFEQVKLPLKIRKDFDKERFIEDLREFFNNCDGS